MVKTLTDKFKIGMKKGGKLDLVTAVNGKDYEAKFNDVYSTAQNDREKYEKLLNRYSDGDILKQEKKNYGFGKKTKIALATLAAITGLTLASCNPINDPRPDPEPTTENPDDGNDGGNDNPVDPIPDTDYVDISGRLQDCETNTNQTGTIQVYDTKNPDGTYSNLLGETTANSDGEFSLTLNNKKIDCSDKIYLRARIPTSYIRTLELPATDNNPITDTDARANPAIRCVPYATSDVDGNGIITTDDDIKYSEQTEDINIVPGRGLVKYDITDIGILTTNPLTGDIIEGIERTNLETAINQWGTILSSARADGKKLNVVPITAGVDYDSSTLTPRKGLILLVEDTRINDEASGDTELYSYTNPFIVESALCRFDSTGSLNKTTIPLHELGHALFSAFHSDAGVPSIMASGESGYMTTDLRYVDEKEVKTIYEETYLPEEKLEDILGLN